MEAHPWGSLGMFRSIAEGLEDAIKARSSTENRVLRGGSADPIVGQQMIDWAKDKEEDYRKLLLREYEFHVPEHVQDWAAGIPGMASGTLFPMLLGRLGHPNIAIPYRWEEGKAHKRVLVEDGDPYERDVRQLWEFAGCGDPESNPKYLTHPTQAQILWAGKRAQVRPVLYRWTAYMVSQYKRNENIANSKYWKLYTAANEDGLTKDHQRQCQNHKRPPLAPNGCGTVEHPEWGAPGSPWRKGHARAHAHRMVHKAFLEELWHIARQ